MYFRKNNNTYLNDDTVYNITQHNKLGIDRIKLLSCDFLLWIIYATCESFHFVIPFNVAMTIALIYGCILLSWHWYFNHRGGLFSEFEQKLKHENNFFKSPDIPERLPIFNGYIFIEGNYAITITSYVVVIGRDIDLNTQYDFNIYIGDKKWVERGYSMSDWDKFLKQCLIEVETSYWKITAIKDEFGTYIWIRGSEYQESKFYKFFNSFVLLIIKAIVLLGMLLPIFMLLRLSK